jgi:branched-chain amino acid transport system permease protein
LLWQFLLMDGLTNGMMYALLSLALILVFAVTRVILIPIGELMMFAPLSFAVLRNGEIPGTLWLSVVILLGWAFADRRSYRVAIATVLGAAALVGLNMWAAAGAPAAVAWFAAALTVLPVGPALYRLLFQQTATAGVLLNMILAIGIHFVLRGLGLLLFGPEQYRVPPILPGSLTFGAIPVANQALVLFAFGALLMVGFYFFTRRTLFGKALIACAVNRMGARLSGIDPATAGQVAFAVSTAVAIAAGMIIGPMTNVAYYMGFYLALKGFVAAIIGALASYPTAVAGALLVGLLESYSSFVASAFKEPVVFALILPVLLLLSVRTPTVGGEEE